MIRKDLIPNVSTDDLDPKEPIDGTGESREAKETVVTKTETAVERKPEPPKKERSLFVKAILAFVIVGAIIGIGILLPIKLIPSASSLVANVFNSDKRDDGGETDAGTAAAPEPVAFKVDRPNLRSGDAATITWSGPIRREAQYALQYPCAEGLSVTLNAADGSKAPVQCGTPFRFTSFDNTMSLVIESKYQRLTNLPLTFSASVAGTDAKLADVSIAVINNFPEQPGQSSGSGLGQTGQSSQTIVANGNSSSGGQQGVGSEIGTGPSAPGGTSSGASRPQQSYVAPVGRPDFAIRVYSTGVLDRTTGQFRQASSFSSSDRAAVQFEIINIGTGPTGTWGFSALLPTNDNSVYSSAPQASLASGGSVIFTLGFDNIRAARESAMMIAADPSGAVAETNENNNNATVMFSVPNAPSGQQYGGDADLSVEILSTGRMSGTTFVADSSIETGDRAAVQFRVKNVGGRASSGWRFVANVENGDDDVTYRSPDASSLAPGQSVVLSVAFDGLDAGDRDLEIEIDSFGSDARSGNDRDTVSLDIDR